MRDFIVDWCLFLLAAAIVAIVLTGQATISFGEDGEYWKAKAASEIAIAAIIDAKPVHPSPAKSADSRPVLDFYSASWCGYCRIPEAAYTPAVLAGQPFTLNKLDYDNQPSNLKPYTGNIPAFVDRETGKVVSVGWPGINELIAVWEMETGRASSKPKSVIATKFAAYNSTQLRSFAHSYSGPMTPMARKRDSYWYHLLDHGFAQWQIQGLSEWEAAKIHGAVHAGRISPMYRVDQPQGR